MGTKAESGYALGHQEDALAFMRIRSAERCCEFFRPHVRADSEILDCGCGPGTVTVGLAAWAPEGRTVGIDIAEAQLEGARALAGQLGRENVSFQQGDAFGLPFPDESFDVVFSQALFCHMPNPQKAFDEMMRVLRPGGVVAIRDVIHDLVVLWPEDALFNEVQRLFRRAEERSGGNPNIGRELGTLLDAAGFADVFLTAKFEQPETPEERRGWFGAIAGILESGDLGQLACEQGWITADHLARVVARFREVAEMPGSISALPMGQATGRKPS